MVLSNVCSCKHNTQKVFPDTELQNNKLQNPSVHKKEMKLSSHGIQATSISAAFSRLFRITGECSCFSSSLSFSLLLLGRPPPSSSSYTSNEDSPVGLKEARESCRCAGDLNSMWRDSFPFYVIAIQNVKIPPAPGGG